MNGSQHGSQHGGGYHGSSQHGGEYHHGGGGGGGHSSHGEQHGMQMTNRPLPRHPSNSTLSTIMKSQHTNNSVPYSSPTSGALPPLPRQASQQMMHRQASTQSMSSPPTQAEIAALQRGQPPQEAASPPAPPSEKPVEDRRQHRQVFGWYRDEPLTSDAFTLEQIGSHYTAQPCLNIGSHLMEQAVVDNVKYMTVCMPCYNEGKEEIYKTMLSLLKSVEFLKKARMNEDDAGRAVEAEFQCTRIVFVPILDGVKAMDDSTKEWLSANFKGAFDQLIYPMEDKSPRKKRRSMRKKSYWAKRNKELHVKAVCRKWWYYMHEVMPSSVVNPEETVEDHLLPFYILPIVKQQNHRKHNSHQWFFDAVCQVLGETCTFAFLTDCGTTYDPKCLAILMKELFLKPSLIGTTARQRVEWPNKYFHPCESSPWTFLQGDHDGDKSKKPCWKCYATYFMSPCPIQGFEFEATLVTNLSIFNLVEVLPVMPGPCQLLNWQKMKRNEVVKEYFNLLFKGEINKKESLQLPPQYQKMVDDDLFDIDESDDEDDIEDGDDDILPLLFEDERDDAFSDFDDGSTIVDSVPGNFPTAMQYDYTGKQISDTQSAGGSQQDINEIAAAAAAAHAARPPKLTFTEFLRTNMRLAEDRVLSFVAVFSTTYGTKWIPGAVFYYTPEISWQTLLLQRRRWINGTFASYLFFLQSERARNRLKSRMFDGHSSVKSMVMFLWKLQLFQMLLVFISPSVFGSTGYLGLIDCGNRFPSVFGWANYYLAPNFRVADLYIICCYLFYCWWCLFSHLVKGGRVDESLCQFLAVAGFIYVLPIYISLWSSIFMGGLSVATALVVFSLVAPAVISSAESLKCTKLYLAYLPWFLGLIVFYLIFIPSYSFSRLFDTTWGNRATGTDSSIRASAELTMKRWNFVFVIFLLALNLGFTYALIRGFTFGYTVVLVIMFFVFVPAVIQLFGAVVFWIKMFCYDPYIVYDVPVAFAATVASSPSPNFPLYSMSTENIQASLNNMARKLSTSINPMRESMSNIDSLLGLKSAGTVADKPRVKLVTPSSPTKSRAEKELMLESHQRIPTLIPDALRSSNEDMDHERIDQVMSSSRELVSKDSKMYFAV